MQVCKPDVYTGLAPEQRCLLERREAEQILCILSILSSVFGCLENSESLTTPDLEADLRHLIHQHPYIQVLLDPDTPFHECKKNGSSTHFVLHILSGCEFCLQDPCRPFKTSAFCCKDSRCPVPDVLGQTRDPEIF